jgi:hypothetical protein
VKARTRKLMAYLFINKLIPEVLDPNAGVGYFRCAGGHLHLERTRLAQECVPGARCPIEVVPGKGQGLDR